MIVLLIISILLNIFFVIQCVLISRKYDKIEQKWILSDCNKELKAELVKIQNEIQLCQTTGITGKMLVRIELIDEIIDNRIKELNNE